MPAPRVFSQDVRFIAAASGFGFGSGMNHLDADTIADDDDGANLVVYGSILDQRGSAQGYECGIEKGAP
jgi:hypothetical protein